MYCKTKYLVIELYSLGTELDEDSRRWNTTDWAIRRYSSILYAIYELLHKDFGCSSYGMGGLVKYYCTVISKLATPQYPLGGSVQRTFAWHQMLQEQYGIA
jgi:hypothetical protein